MPTPLATLEALKTRIAALERTTLRDPGALRFGVSAIDAHLPGGGLAQGSLHDIQGEGEAAAAILFAAGILARTGGTILWCATGSQTFAPGLACAGLHPAQAIHARARDEKTVLLLMEEALRHPGLSGVLGELKHLPMTASRRLALAAERSGIIVLALRAGAADPTPNAAATRWRIASLPATPLPSAGIGRARWQVELTRCRGAAAKTWIMEACDAKGALHLPADLADRPAAEERRRA
jgi:protein ImuA